MVASTYKPKSALDDLANKYGTDKGSNWHNFANLYEEIILPFYDTIKGVIEIGVFKGQSLKMWEEYFPEAIIVGIDKNLKQEVKSEGRIKVIEGSQDSQKTLSKAVSLLDGNLNLVIDDGSHINKLTISSYEYLFPLMNPGGIYIIEDSNAASNVGKYYNESQDMFTFINSLFRAIHFNGRRVNQECCDFYKIDPDMTMNYMERWVERITISYGAIIIYKRKR